MTLWLWSHDIVTSCIYFSWFRYLLFHVIVIKGSVRTVAVKQFCQRHNFFVILLRNFTAFRCISVFDIFVFCCWCLFVFTEDIDPTIGRFRNLVQTQVVPMKVGVLSFNNCCKYSVCMKKNKYTCLSICSFWRIKTVYTMHFRMSQKAAMSSQYIVFQKHLV